MVFPYQIEKVKQIKGIAIGLFSIVIICVLNFMSSEKGILIAGSGGAITVMAIIITPIHQVLDGLGKHRFACYLRVGPLKLRYQEFPWPVNLVLIQDAERYYWVTLVLPDETQFQVDRFATLDRANERLGDISKFFALPSPR